MKRKRQKQQTIMQEAIEKASQLINLLQKQNQELKRRYEHIEKQFKEKIAENNELINVNDELEKELIKLEIKFQEYSNQIQELTQQISQQQQHLEKKIKVNKELHEKIAELNLTLKSKNKNNNEQKVKLMSLANQNEYLLKKLKEWEDKEDNTHKKINQISQLHGKEIKELSRVKQAFARKYEEIKVDNMILTETAAEYKQRLIQFQDRTNIIINKSNSMLQYDEPYSRKVKNVPYQILIDKILQDKLSIVPHETFQGKIQQLNSFISYRLSHLQKMCEGIAKKLQLKEWSKFQNLKDLNITCQRINSYLSELITKAI